MKRFENREIETFELKSDYYLNSWINGNKSHVKEELSELFLCNAPIAMAKILELPKDIALSVVNSQQFKDVNLFISLQILGKKDKYNK